MGVTGLQRPVFWGFYIVDFVFWIGISHAGTLISAILRLTDAAWRKPVTRAAEAITVFALMIGGMFPIIHLGRAWLFYWLMPYPNSRLLWPNFRSPLLWDLDGHRHLCDRQRHLSVLAADPRHGATCRAQRTPWRRKLYRTLSLGWTGSDREWHALERAMKLMACIILAVAVSVHTVVAWDFAMAIAPMWHSTIFGPYFVVGAIFSGIAALMLVMAIIRQVAAPGGVSDQASLRQSGQAAASDEPAVVLLHARRKPDRLVRQRSQAKWRSSAPARAGITRLTSGPWCSCNFVVPFVLLGIRKLAHHHHRHDRHPLRADRHVDGALHHRGSHAGAIRGCPRRPSFYTPTWVEVAITAATFAAMVMLYMIFSKLFPIIAVWEFKPHPQEDRLDVAI